jgi:hypothetical protein
MKPRVPIRQSSSLIDSVEACPHWHLASSTMDFGATRLLQARTPALVRFTVSMCYGAWGTLPRVQ